MRIPLIAGNWKMNKTAAEAQSFIMELFPILEDASRTEVLICPPFISLYILNRLLENTGIKLGAQDVFWEENGAYTGEISASMLIDTGCSYVIIGHSERRQLIGENDDIIHNKLMKALNSGLIPILCVGETLEERQRGRAFEIVGNQMDKALEGVATADGDKLVIAYEPVWAIGTGLNASARDAQEMSRFIRDRLTEIFGGTRAQTVRILYGGSVKEDNIKEFVKQEDIDGALVGGASIKAVSFANIVRLGGNG